MTKDEGDNALAKLAEFFDAHNLPLLRQSLDDYVTSGRYVRDLEQQEKQEKDADT